MMTCSLYLGKAYHIRLFAFAMGNWANAHVYTCECILYLWVHAYDHEYIPI